MGVSIKFTLDPINQILAKRGLNSGGSVQKVIDSTVLRCCDPYIPIDSRTMKISGSTATVIGSGVVEWNTPYARRQYYENKGKSGGMRGKLWFERMKADRLDDIVKAAAAEAGGEKDNGY